MEIQHFNCLAIFPITHFKSVIEDIDPKYLAPFLDKFAEFSQVIKMFYKAKKQEPKKINQEESKRSPFALSFTQTENEPILALIELPLKKLISILEQNRDNGFKMFLNARKDLAFSEIEENFVLLKVIHNMFK